MVKIIGMNEKIAMTALSAKECAQSNSVFIEACKKTAEKLDIPVSSLITKRQASKFMRDCGIVFNTAIKKAS